jgi:hypothetical protein
MCDSGSKNYTKQFCDNARNSGVTDRFESRCQSRSDRYDEEFAKTNFQWRLLFLDKVLTADRNPQGRLATTNSINAVNKCIG